MWNLSQCFLQTCKWFISVCLLGIRFQTTGLIADWLTEKASLCEPYADATGDRPPYFSTGDVWPSPAFPGGLAVR